MPDCIYSDEQLHAFARVEASCLKNPDKKQLRFNEIVQVAKDFYRDPMAGVRELVSACCKDNAALYVKAVPMHASLRDSYAWMKNPAENEV